MGWEVTLKAMQGNKGVTYEVARRFPGLSVLETRLFTSEKRALAQLREWVREAPFLGDE